MLCASLSGYAEKITLTGSDLLEPIIAKPIESAAKKNGIDLTLKMEGTYAAVDAIKNGVRRVHFVDGYLPHSILLEIFTDTGIGTEIVTDAE